jgi:hypothetical protein
MEGGTGIRSWGAETWVFPSAGLLAWLITDRADRNEQRRLTECVFVLRWYKVKNRPYFSAFCEQGDTWSLLLLLPPEY